MPSLIKKIVLHCSDSTFGDAATIKKWHTLPPPQGRGWKDIGYNAVILNGIRDPKGKYNIKADGLLEMGRGLNFDAYISPEEIGAHTLGYNDKAIGICLIGQTFFSLPQFLTLFHLLKTFLSIIPDLGIENIQGHGELYKKKTCPNFSVENIRELLKDPISEHYLRVWYQSSDWLK